MNRKRIVLITSIGAELSTAMARMLSNEKIDCQVFDATDSKNVVFEPEPILFHNHRKEWIEPKLYNDVPRNKFIDKPRHNFKKR